MEVLRAFLYAIKEDFLGGLNEMFRFLNTTKELRVFESLSL